MATRKSVFKEENFIPGVFNYCNSWCERCRFRLRCRNYAMTADEDGNPIDIHEDGGLERIEENMRKAMDMLAEHDDDSPDFMEEFRDMPEPDPEDVKEWEEEDRRTRKDAERHPLSPLSMRYLDDARAWLDTNREQIDKRLRQLQSQTATHNEGSQLADASEVVHWYVYMIHVKIQRALVGRDDMYDESWGTPVQSDANGSAKVALLGAEGSLSGWVTVVEAMPEARAELLPLMALLRGIIRGIEHTFPDVRKFVRAGFDDGTM